jgi:hypothetical protein
VTEPTDRQGTRWRKAAVMGVVGALFVVLALATLSPLWEAAAAVNFIGAADAILRPYYLPAVAA